MNLQTRIVLICMGAVLLISALLCFSTAGPNETGEVFAASYGIIAMIAGGIALLTGIIILIAGNKEWAQGFLIAGGILALTGFLTCGVMLNGGIR